MDIQIFTLDRGSKGPLRNLIANRLAVIIEKLLGVVDTVEFPEALDEVRLPPHQQPAGEESDFPHRSPAQMLLIEHLLGLDELAIEVGKGQSGREHTMLD